MGKFFDDNGYEVSDDADYYEDEVKQSRQPQQPQSPVVTEEAPWVPQFADEDEAVEPNSMFEAKRKISLANYYIQLAGGGIFADGSEESRIVDEEVKEFASKRMSELLGIGTPTKQTTVDPVVQNILSQLTPERLNALIQMADRLIQKGNTPVPAVTRPTIIPVVAPKPVVMAPKPAPKTNPNLQQQPPKPAKTAPPEPEKPKQQQRRKKVDFEDREIGEEYSEGGKTWKVVASPSTGKKMRVSVGKQVKSPHSKTPLLGAEAAYVSAQQSSASTQNMQPTDRGIYETKGPR